MPRIALATCLLVAVGGNATAQDHIERGRALVSELCGGCHAVSRTGSSPHAGAPAFRQLEERIDLDEFMNQLRAGLQSTHADMPSFRFSRDDARAVTAYLRSIQGP